MRKLFCLFTFFTFTLLFSSNFTISASGEADVVEYSTKREVRTITDKKELLKIGKESNFEDYELLTSLTIITFEDENENILPVTDNVISTFGLFNEEFYIKNSSVKEPVIQFGPLLKEKFLPSYETVSMYVSGTYPVYVDYTVEINDADFYDSIGYSRDSSVTITSNSPYTSDKDYDQKVVCYRQDEITEFQIWEDDVWEDDFVGFFTAKRPVGYFIATIKAV